MDLRDGLLCRVRPSWTSGATALQVTSSGEIFVAGHSKGALDGNANLGDADLFVMKLDPSGAWQWTLQRGSTELDEVAALQLDRHGALILAGSTKGSLDGFANAGVDDLFVMKLNETKWIWTHQRGTRYEDRTTALQVTSDEIYVTGYTKGSLAGVNLGESDAFVMKLDSSGDLLWIVQRGSSMHDGVLSMVLNSGTLLVAGFSQGSLDGSVNAGLDDLLVMSYDVNGTWLWTQLEGSTESDVATALAVTSQNE
ncbi:unnamed protein product, partial [Durusdinium trenchii]